MYVVKQLFIQQTTATTNNNTSTDNNTNNSHNSHTQDTEANTMEIGAIRILYPLTNRVSIKV